MLSIGLELLIASSDSEMVILMYWYLFSFWSAAVSYSDKAVKNWLLKSLLRNKLLWQAELLTVGEVYYLNKILSLKHAEFLLIKSFLSNRGLLAVTRQISFLKYHHLACKDWKITFNSKRNFSSVWIQFLSHCLTSLFGPTPTNIKGLSAEKTVVHAAFRTRQIRWDLVN